MKKIEVQFLGGEGSKIITDSNGMTVCDSCNYMLADVDVDGETIRLYAEINCSDYPEYSGEYPDFDDFTYPLLKEEIIRQAIEKGIDPDTLKFARD